jgi:pyridinium-3,5-bisthiocarboxylic acid mononucleotide nickel chelatase
VQVLSDGPPPAYRPVRSGFGAGTKDFVGRANALRIVLADSVTSDVEGTETLVLLAADVDDLSGEYLAGAADRLREAGALDVVLLATTMKKGRPGTRIEVLAHPSRAESLEAVLFGETSTLGIRRSQVVRRALPREERRVLVLGHELRVKLARLPDGSLRGKPEYDDVRAVSLATGRPARDIFDLARQAIADAGTGDDRDG